MSNFLNVALDCARRGWHVHPLKPGGKIPITAHGKNDATTDEEQIRAWWAEVPTANIGIACGPSKLCVLDVDHGLNSVEEFNAWRIAAGLPETYTVRTGRRPGFGVQMYFDGPIPDVGLFELNGCSGQVKSLGGLVLAAGCLHPSGEYYAPICDAEIQPTPEVVRKLQKPRAEVKPGEPIRKLRAGEGRRPLLMAKLGTLFNAGLSRDALLTALVDINQTHCEDLVPLDILEKMVDGNVGKWTLPAPEPRLLPINKAPEPVGKKDWRSRYHTLDEAKNAPPISFLIDGFLQRDGVTAICGPVRERKSLIALNIVHALLTGEKLFDHFIVVKKPERILYLCPEVALSPFTDRIKKIGLLDHVGDRFFYRTLSADGEVKLADLDEELPGSVVFLDTAIRFLEGKENDSSDVRKLADSIFALLKGGSESVIVLHHAPKEMGDTMTLESALRGSGDLGAFLTSCWGTRLQDPSKPYESSSYLENLKQRDFESQPFEVTSGPDCRLHIVPSSTTVTLQPRKGFKTKKGEDVALQILRDNPKLSLRAMAAKLKEAGVGREKDWVKEKRFTSLQENGGDLSGDAQK